MNARLLFCALLLSGCASLPRERSITLYHFSDYHSHAVPFFSEDEHQQGGIARAIGYLTAQRKAEPWALVFSGGDMINKGAPAWSDKYSCAEWGWFNGIVDAMAYGNHDSDYGPKEFARCRRELSYPIIGANVVDTTGERIFDVYGKPYLVFQRAGLKVGVFSLAGADFATLVRPELRPAEGATFTDRVEAARKIVSDLRGRESVDAVVLIGHAHREEDEALAREVAGIDLIFGTHSHIKAELTTIDGTTTRYISPYQYLAYVSRVKMTFGDSGVSGITGGLVRVDERLPLDAGVAERVAKMQKELERDPRFTDLFVELGVAPRDYSLRDQLTAQTDLALHLLNIVRDAANVDLMLSTTSSFRQPIARGPIRVEDLRATLPYPNKVLVARLKGSELRELLRLSESKRGSDSFAQSSEAIQSIDDSRMYRIATTDYLAKVAPGYREFFAGRELSDSGLEVRETVARYIREHWSVATLR